jgi:hypothetical protein
MKKTAHNTGLAKVAVQCSEDTFVVNQSLVLRINICGENRHLRQAAKRCAAIPAGLRRNDRSASRTAVRRPSGLRTTVRLAKLKKFTRYARLFSTSPSGAVVSGQFRERHRNDKQKKET